MTAGTPSTPQDLFHNSPEGLDLCLAVQDFITALVEATHRTTISQMAFRHRRAFAWVWNPRQHLKTAVPAVLSIALPRRVDSARFKEVAHVSPGEWMHHLELHKASQLDDEVAGWLREAFAAAA
ncbi:DUF5655 domain-containing protein [Pseudarthrobacter sp. BIM B-2242]|jgi:hypothetical protein|uniref:DUF5655 domain-containing protein n=1 Tax=Pseudarthrobacter sp. BIM B-2242 TaxID=2772401 RepID=UPI00168A9F01|nr:DUF5655 domain-containing protein [Pseudarthrobacter sp. BIM B-2242]QOD05174.1 hypothetical protein IDT60_09275 [Pseudarthrobacter sp. BIM B-2242]